MTTLPQASDPESLERLFGRGDLLPLWIAEPYVELAPPITEALAERASNQWYGYEVRPDSLATGFWSWMKSRHGWERGDLRTMVSPAAGSSVGALLSQHTAAGDGVIISPPVFTDFKTLIRSNRRKLIKNPLVLGDAGYEMDFDDLEAKAAVETTTAMILCSPHNPVGRVWRQDELVRIADICAANNVFVIADEIHADLILGDASFTPFAEAAVVGSRWAAIHGPIKTFGLAGLSDTLIITDSDEVADSFNALSSRLHLTRNNVFGMAAFEAAYANGATWLDDFLRLIETNAALLTETLPPRVELIPMDGTYLAWLDFRALDLGVRGLPEWLSAAGLAMSPGHWFGREGAGFARMTIAVPPETIERAVAALRAAVENDPR